MEKRKKTYTAEEYLEEKKRVKEAKEKRDKEYKENWDRQISEYKEEYDRQLSEVFGKIEKFFPPDGITPEEYARAEEMEHKDTKFVNIRSTDPKIQKKENTFIISLPAEVDAELERVKAYNDKRHFCRVYKKYFEKKMSFQMYCDIYIPYIGRQGEKGWNYDNLRHIKYTMETK